jgi:hypothetical protein
MSDEEEKETSISINLEESKPVLKLSKNQLKALGLEYKAPQSEKQQARNMKLSEMSKARHDKLRKEKEEYEQQQVRELKNKVSIKTKPKKTYVKQMVEIPEEEYEADDESEEVREYAEFQKYKLAKQKAKKTVKAEPKEEEDDDFIQKKAQKATAVLETINKLDNAINKISSHANPYLEFFNKKK